MLGQEQVPINYVNYLSAPTFALVVVFLLGTDSISSAGV